MFRFTLILLLLASGRVPASADSRPEFRVETGHLVLAGREGDLSEAGLDRARELGETYYREIRSLLGHDPPAKVVIWFGGHAEQPDGSWDYPRVDGWGRILLFRFTDSDESYFNALAHEMVHAFRIRRPDKDWFFEEALAEFVALRLDPSLDGFPWFGYPVDVVAGHWFEADESIPLRELQERHRELNRSCRLQAYSLRASFFLYLGHAYGDEKLLEIAALDASGAPEHFERVFGKPFEDLEREWREHVMEEFARIPGAAETAHRFRTRSPARYQNVCGEAEGR